MNGLEAIQDRILTEAREKADRIMTQAQSQCAEMLAAAESEKKQLIAAEQEITDRMADTLIKRASSAAALEGRRIILQARQAQIDRAMDRALEILSEMPGDKKLPLYRSLLQQTGATAGEITLAAADLDLGASLLQGLDGQFTLSATAGSFIGGLILWHGQIEDNLTFERLAAINRPQLVKLADDVLAGDASENSGRP